LISAASFVIGLMFTIKLPNISQEKELEPGTTKKMIVIMVIGLVIDSLVFKRLENKVMSRWGLR